MLLVPAGHFGGIADVPPEKAAPMLAALQVTTQAVKAAFGASGTTVRLNLGPPAQDIFHLHWHIIPRYVGDDFNSAKSSEVPLSERLQGHVHAGGVTGRLDHFWVESSGFGRLNVAP